MENLKEEYFLWSNKKLTDFGKDTSLVKNEQSGEISVCKRINGNVAVYKKLLGVRSRVLSSVTNVFEFENNSYALIEYAAGRTLKSYIEDGRLFNERETAEITAELCDGLSTLHSNGIIHRDVTAANVLISQDGAIKIIDYGIARMPRNDANKDTQILGTAGFAAPEQFGVAQSDERTDIYSLGVLINVMLTGKFPTDEMCKGYFANIVKRCISIEASKRFKSIKELKSYILRTGNTIEENTTHKTCKKGIPGLRSKNPFVFVLSILVYFVAIFFAVVSVCISYEVGTVYAIIELVNIIFTTVLPYVLIHNIFDARDKLPLIRSVPNDKKREVVTLCSIVLISVGLAVFFAIN